MIERSEYKGSKILVLKRNQDDKFPFSFGLAKAKLILENMDEIKKFVNESSVDKAIEKPVNDIIKDKTEAAE